MGFPRTIPNLLLFLLLGAISICSIPRLRAENIKCGQRNVGGVDPESRSSEFSESDFGEFPWTIEIRNMKQETNDLCSGALIHPSVVITAAHCVELYEAKDFRIRAGLWDRKVQNEHLPYQERSVADIISHPDRNERKRIHDMALVIVNEPFTMAAHINTICLPPAKHITANGTACYASGWGTQTEDTKEYSRKLKRVILSTLDSEICKKEMGLPNLDNSRLCAVGLNDTDTCKGDGGAPLISRIGGDITHTEQYHLIGISSFGSGCFRGFPSMYANVANAREWIDAQMAAAGFGTSSHSAAITEECLCECTCT